MKKKSIISTIIGFFLLVFGLSSCIKNSNCVEVSKDDVSSCFCVGDIGLDTKKTFDAYVKGLKGIGYKVKYVNECPEV